MSSTIGPASGGVCELPEPEETVCVDTSPPAEDLVCEAPDSQTTAAAAHAHQKELTPAQIRLAQHGAKTHGAEHGGGHHSPADTAAHVAQGADIALATAEAAKHGSHAIETLGHVPSPGMAGATAIVAPAAIGAGAYEIYQGVTNPDKAEGAVEVVKGTTSVVGGVAGIGALAGSSAAAATAPAAAAFGGGLTLGHYGDGAAKDLGLLHDRNGNAESVSDRLARHATETHDAVERATGSSTLGHVAAAGRGLSELPAAGATAVYAAGAKGVGALGDALGITQPLAPTIVKQMADTMKKAQAKLAATEAESGGICLPEE